MVSRPVARLTAKEKREKAVRARLDGHTLSECAEIAGYASTGAASAAISEYLKRYPAEDVEERRAIERMRLESLIVEATEILRRRHVVVNAKGIVGQWSSRIRRDETGEFMYVQDREGNYRPVYEFEPLEDDDPALRAIVVIKQLSESLRKLLGLDSPVRIELDNGEVDQEIRDLVAAMQEQPIAIPEGHEG